MSRTVKYILIGICGFMLAAIIAVAYIYGSQSRQKIVCKKVEIRILDSLRNDFVTTKDVAGYLRKEYGDCIGLQIDSIDKKRIEEIIDGKSAVEKSQAFSTTDGVLHIEVTQRQPVVRFQKKDGGFYADAGGYIFPLQKNFASHVQVIDGNIPLAANSGYKGAINDPKEKAWFENIMKVVNFMEADKVWKGKIVQITIDEGGNLILIPRKGSERFLIGQPDDIEEKFRKMEMYYTHILPGKGENYYRTVDLQYDGRIVCRQNNR